MQAGLESFLLVAVSEMGDKTQLLALVLASRFRKPWAIMAGILVATILNHALASWIGVHLAHFVPADIMKWVLAFTFFTFAGWLLIPDSEEDLKERSHHGAFLTTLVTFFLAEMGDKTQIATLALGAKFKSTLWVTMGTTMGMLVADGLAVFFGDELTKRISLKWVHRIACALFVAFGIAILLGF